MTTRAFQLKLPHGVITLPAGLRVKPAPSTFTAPMDDWYALDEFPEDIFPHNSTFRDATIHGHFPLLGEKQVNLP